MRNYGFASALLRTPRFIYKTSPFNSDARSFRRLDARVSLVRCDGILFSRSFYPPRARAQICSKNAGFLALHNFDISSDRLALLADIVVANLCRMKRKIFTDDRARRVLAHERGVHPTSAFGKREEGKGRSRRVSFQLGAA